MIAYRDRVRFVETDTMGVVHHSNYLHWFEKGRVELLRAVGIDLNEMMQDGFVFPIVEVNVKYKNTCAFDDEYEVQTSLVVLSKVRTEYLQKVIRLRDGAVAVEGKVRGAFTDKEGRVTRLNEFWYEKMKQVLALCKNTEA